MSDAEDNAPTLLFILATNFNSFVVLLGGKAIHRVSPRESSFQGVCHVREGTCHTQRRDPHLGDSSDVVRVWGFARERRDAGME